MSLISQSYPNLCNHMDCSPPGSSVHGDSPGKNTGVGCYVLLQGIFPTQGFNPGLPHCRQSQEVDRSLSHMKQNDWVCLLSRVQLFVTPWIAACQSLLSMRFSRQEYWSGLHAFLQGFFWTQGLNPHLPYSRWILYCWVTREATEKYLWCAKLRFMR